MWNKSYPYIFLNLIRLTAEIKAIYSHLSSISVNIDDAEIVLHFISVPSTLALDVIEAHLEQYDDQPTPEQTITGMMQLAEELGVEIIENFKLRNNLEGITEPQSSWAMQRSAHILNLLREGAIGTAYMESFQFVPDDMSEEYHWMTQARIDSVKVEILVAIQKVTGQ